MTRYELPPLRGVLGFGCLVVPEGNEHDQRCAEQYRREQEAPAGTGEHHEQRVGACGRMQRARQLHERDGGADRKGEAPRVHAERSDGAEPDERAQHVAADEAAGLGERALRESEGDDAGGAEWGHQQRGVGEVAEQAAQQDGDEAADAGDELDEQGRESWTKTCEHVWYLFSMIGFLLAIKTTCKTRSLILEVLRQKLCVQSELNVPWGFGDTKGNYVPLIREKAGF